MGLPNKSHCCFREICTPGMSAMVVTCVGSAGITALLAGSRAERQSHRSRASHGCFTRKRTSARTTNCISGGCCLLNDALFDALKLCGSIGICGTSCRLSVHTSVSHGCIVAKWCEIRLRLLLITSRNLHNALINIQRP